MNTLPDEFVNKETVPMSHMELDVKYPVPRDGLRLDLERRFWIHSNYHFRRELDEYDHEESAVYVKKTINENNAPVLTVHIPGVFSKRRKWYCEEWIDSADYVMIGEIVVE